MANLMANIRITNQNYGRTNRKLAYRSLPTGSLTQLQNMKDVWMIYCTVPIKNCKISQLRESLPEDNLKYENHQNLGHGHVHILARPFFADKQCGLCCGGISRSWCLISSLLQFPFFILVMPIPLHSVCLKKGGFNSTDCLSKSSPL